MNSLKPAWAIMFLTSVGSSPFKASELVINIAHDIDRRKRGVGSLLSKPFVTETFSRISDRSAERDV